jgi:2-polyprenyl-3-methyl-5-hydroxy-6-metoxy-1,4-benzoquinol methylase
MVMQELDASRAEAFAGRMLGVVNSGMLALMVSVGHRTGLFDTMADLEPADSTRIAEAAGLQERYVREWLGAMVTGGIVEYDPASGTYWLPPEHAMSITRAAGPGNVGSYTQFIAMLGQVEGDIVESFRNGGGVPYAKFPEFTRLMAEDSGMVFDAALIDTVLPLVEGLPERLVEGIRVADVGCGSGHAINLMASAYPASQFVGYDFSAEAVAAATAEAASLGLANARFEERDVATLGDAPAYDFVTTFDSVHDQAQPAVVLRAIHDMVRPGGTYLCVDIRASSDVADNVNHPLGAFLYTVSCMHCMTVSLAQGGAGLGAAWGEQTALAMLAEAGFSDVRVETVDGDIANNYYVATNR